MTEPAAPEPFGLMLRRPGDVANPDATWGDPDRLEGIYLAPDFTQRHADWDPAGSDPRNYIGGENDWALSLPHSCGEWTIGYGSREDVLADALRLHDELGQAIAAMEAAGELQPHQVALSVRQPTGGSYSVAHPPPCHRLPYGQQCEFDLALWRGRKLLPRELGVYDATLGEDGAPVFTWLRELAPGDWHG